jgi:hypothetical protein
MLAYFSTLYIHASKSCFFLAANVSGHSGLKLSGTFAEAWEITSDIDIEPVDKLDLSERAGLPERVVLAVGIDTASSKDTDIRSSNVVALGVLCLYVVNALSKHCIISSLRFCTAAVNCYETSFDISCDCILLVLLYSRSIDACLARYCCKYGGILLYI